MTIKFYELICFRRFGPAVFSTKEQQDQRVLYTKILEFEQETVSSLAYTTGTVFQRMDNTICQITSMFCRETLIHWMAIYLVESIIHQLNIRGQIVQHA